MGIRLLIADHQEVMRLGLKSFLARSVVEVVAETASPRELMRLVTQTKPDVVLLDVRFCNDDGFATLNKLKRKWPDLAVLMWATSDNPTYIARSMALGANGFLQRGIGRRELLATIRTAATKDNAWTKQQLERFTSPITVPEGVDVPLTPRELDVLQLLGYGLPNKEIGRALGISYETVKEHVQHILFKLEATDRTQAAVWALRNGLV